MRELRLVKEGHLINIFNSAFPKRKVRYNFKTRSMERYYPERKLWDQVAHQYDFFLNVSFEDIVCDEEKFRDMINKTRLLNPLCKSMSSFISRLNEGIVYENYIKEGIETECSSNLDYYGSVQKHALTKPLKFYHKSIVEFFKRNEITVTMEVEKNFTDDYKFLEQVCTVLNGINMSSESRREIFNLATDSYHRNLKSLCETYQFDLKSLIRYVVEYLEPFEDIDAGDGLELLCDYYRMASEIGRNVKKYPKYLKSMHDIITCNHRAYKKQYDEDLFANLIRKDLEQKGKVYSIVVPKVPKDVIQEGTDLNHCVGSYVDKILAKTSYIMFLRLTKFKEDSLVTLEIKDNSIVNAKGSYNRVMNVEEEVYLKKYCKLKKLGINL